MDDSLGGMFKLTGSNYSVWKSKMSDMLVVKDFLAAGSVRGQETGQDRCHDMGGNAHENNDIHMMLH